MGHVREAAATLSCRFSTLTLIVKMPRRVTTEAAIPLGHWDLFKICLEIAESGEIRGASEEELVPLAKLAEESRPLFEGASV